MKKIDAPKAQPATGPYAHGYVHNGLLFTAGQIGMDGSGHLAEGIEGQAEMACRNVGEVLKAAGSGFDQVLKTTCFIADMGDFEQFNAMYAKFFVTCPARTCVAVKSLPKGALCEIEAVAVVEKNKK